MSISQPGDDVNIPNQAIMRTINPIQAKQSPSVSQPGNIDDNIPTRQ
jgi:hypothetical protein